MVASCTVTSAVVVSDTDKPELLKMVIRGFDKVGCTEVISPLSSSSKRSARLRKRKQESNKLAQQA